MLVKFNIDSCILPSVKILTRISLIGFLTFSFSLHANDIQDVQTDVNRDEISQSSVGVSLLERKLVDTPNGPVESSYDDKSVRVKLLPAGAFYLDEKDENILNILSEEIKAQEPKIETEVSRSSYTEVLNGDFNGDGCTDTATVFVNSDRIEIFHPCNNRTSSYQFSGGIAINGIYDTDGESGLEIVVVNAPYLKIIDDADSRTRSYTLGNSWAINGNYEANGTAGNEIGIVSAPYFKMIDDKRQRITDYMLGNSWAINGNYDADGLAGVEIGIVQPQNLTFIRERSRNTFSFYMGFTSYSINGTYETNGTVGEEMGIVRSGSFNLYDLRSGTYRTYGIPGAYFINGAQNIDGSAGKEVLINNYSYSRNATVYDAQNRITFSNY